MGERHAGLVISFNLVKIICRSLIICVDPDVINFTVQLKIGGKRDPKKLYIHCIYIYIYMIVCYKTLPKSSWNTKVAVRVLFELTPTPVTLLLASFQLHCISFDLASGFWWAVVLGGFQHLWWEILKGYPIMEWDWEIYSFIWRI